MISDILQRAAEHSGVSILVLDRTLQVLWANAATTELTGYSTSQLLGQSPDFIPNLPSLLQRARSAIKQDGRWQGEVSGIKADGSPLPLVINLSALLGESEEWVITLTDISAVRLYTEQLERMIGVDPLTRLPNREAFKESVANLLYRARRAGVRFAVLFIDFDGFKSVNDTAGHDVGDKVLIQASHRLRDIALQHGAQLARLGGDEFASTLDAHDIKAQAVHHYCEHIVASIARPFVLAGKQFSIGASIGVCIGPQQDDTVTNLLRRADQAMYHVKEKGGQGYWLHPVTSDVLDITPVADEALKFDAALRAHELRPFYQPIVELSAGRITAIEARIRWESSEQGLLTASHVLKLAKASGYESEVDYLVLEQAAQDLLSLRENLVVGVRLAVNISVKTCQQEGFVSRTLDVLRCSGVRPVSMMLEIPVEAFVDNVDRMEQVCRELASMGFELAVDHVNEQEQITRYLAQLPVSVIKLEERLIDDLTGNNNTEETVRSICLTARRQGLRVVAEGIARLDQLECLREIGCQEGQGRLISKPHPVNNLMGVLKRGRCW